MSTEELKLKCVELVTPNLSNQIGIQLNVVNVIENAQKIYDFISVDNQRILNASEKRSI